MNNHKNNNSQEQKPATVGEVKQIVRASQEEILEAMLEAMGMYSNKVEEQFGKVEARFDKIEATMVTKDYLEEKLNEKLFDLRGDLVVLMRKEDTKLKELVEILQEKKVLKPRDVSRIFSMEPFAKIASL